MPERHPQPRVGVSATYVRAGGDETSPAHPRSRSAGSALGLVLLKADGFDAGESRRRRTWLIRTTALPSTL
jgi:hypothetical protein